LSYLRRTAIHESGHCIIALRSFMLPVKEAFICNNGSGGVSYSRRIGLGEIDRVVTVGFAGPAAEALQFGSADESGDLRVIKTMLRRLDLSWSDRVLAEYRDRARHLVKCESRAIEVLAEVLLQRRHLSGDELAALVPVEPAEVPWVT